jgi:hypothetical protein
MLAFAGAATVPVLSSFVGVEGWLPDTAGVLALLVAAAALVLFVGRPVVRWALAGGIVGLAAASVVGWLVAEDRSSPVRFGDLGRLSQQWAESDYTASLLLAAATLAFTVGVAALPQFRRPVWPTALACVVALVPVAIVASDAAGVRDLSLSGTVPAGVWWQLAPGLVATVLAGLAFVLAVSRAERWHLLPAGALLVQVSVAHWTWSSSSAWEMAQIFGGGRGTAVSSAFLEPGLRMEAPATATATVAIDADLGAALATAVFLLGPALLAAGATRTAAAAEPAPTPEPAAAGPGAADPAEHGAAGAGDAGPAEAHGEDADDADEPERPQNA